MTDLTVQKVTNDALKRAATTRQQSLFLRHAFAATCGNVRQQFQNSHIANDKCGNFAARECGASYIYKYIYRAIAPDIFTHI